MRYVLDTTTVSALMRSDASAIRRLTRAERSDVGIPQPVVAEIRYGLERLPRSRRKELLTTRFELLLREVQRVTWSDEVSAAFGLIKATLERRGERIEDFDAAVAAHAIAERAILVSGNLKHMTRVPDLAVEDWTRS